MVAEFDVRPLIARSIHLCVDMQRLFTDEGPWPTPWMPRVLPVIVEIAGRFPERTIFTRFMTPEAPEEMPGAWRRYYDKWAETTRARLHPQLLELVPPLGRLAPPATIIDKMRYSAFSGSGLDAHLRQREADTLIVTGSETDVCVVATVLGAVDRGYRVILVRDGICSSSDAGHDALLTVYQNRYSMQIEIATAEEILHHWR
jgi:nicotinamidase-related amidase